MCYKIDMFDGICKQLENQLKMIDVNHQTNMLIVKRVDAEYKMSLDNM